ncbi:MAG: hypothetical protein ACOX6D_02380 [Thermoguttaceae bacterium]|jgi:predicted membrane channel-forming protein YqfA (hemolysin III family)
MCLLITIFAAVTVTVKWYNRNDENMKLGILCFLFWGASIMWFVDAIFEYAASPENFFSPTPGEMLNDAYLGLSVVALGLVIWLVCLLIADPKGSVAAALKKQKD